MKNGDRQRFEELRQELTERLNTLAEMTADILEPLKTLDDRQLQAVATVGSLARVLTFVQRPPHKVASGTFDRFKYEIDQVCPPLGQELVSPDPCFDSTVSYLSALKECEDDGETEEECEDAWGPGSQAVMHVMQAIDKVEHRIGLPGGRGPQPQPPPI